VLDRPAAAVMVFAGRLALGHREATADSVEPSLSYAGSHFPCAWGDAREKHFGGSFAGHPGHVEPVAWQQSRLAGHCSVQIFGTRIDIGVSRGWRLLGEPTAVDSSRAYDLLRLGGESALEQLLRSLPGNHHRPAPLPLASLCAVLIDDLGSVGERFAFDEAAYHPIAIIAANPDKSLTLAERVAPGQRLAWAMRTPQAAAADMHRSVDHLAVAVPDPVAADHVLLYRPRPLFHGGEDHDVDCLRKRFPGLPLIGSLRHRADRAAPGGRQSLAAECRGHRLDQHLNPEADVQSQS
jgi:small ligand-binding sensory domain FIST